MTGLPNIAYGRYVAGLAACIALAMAAGAFGAQFAPGTWYAELAKPSLTPPGWVFPVVWTLLYIGMGAALFAFLIEAPEHARRAPVALFVTQLVLNAAWSWLFFGRHAMGWALIEIVVLWISIAATSVLFSRHSRLAGRLLLPYLAWVSFATYLNAALVAAN